MGLADRLESYEVTTVPTTRPRLRLAWSAADEDEATAGDTRVDLTADLRDGNDGPVVRLLSAYRITLVPGLSTVE